MGRNESDVGTNLGAVPTDPEPVGKKDLSMSRYVGTRKMVNYAWVG